MQENAENKFNLELGQIIKIISPNNDNLHEKMFFIDYLDEKNIILINQKEEKIVELNVSNGVITDESIEIIEILYKPKESGYARQNNLIVGNGISIEFGGDGTVPMIINGEITNLEEDMVEIEIFPSKKKIYIDFKYQGVPKKLNIISIRPFTKPESTASKEREERDRQGESQGERRDENHGDQGESPIEFEEDELDDLELNYEEAENEEKLNIIIIDADDIIFSKEKFSEVSQMVHINEENKRFSIEQQVTDLLDNLLSTVATKKRTKRVINEINKTIVRFKELRIDFSNFKEDGVINKPKLNYKDGVHKPLLNKLLNLENDFKWLIPVVKNKKKLYDIKLFGEEKMNDYIADTTENYIESFNATLNLQATDDLNSSNNKYKFIRERLNNIQKNFVAPNLKENVISKIKISTDIHTIIDNDNLNSSVYFNENVRLHKNYIQKYIIGEDILHKKDFSKFFTKKKIIENENVFLKGFIIMPGKFKEYTKLFLNERNLYEKVVLNRSNINYNILENIELENFEIDENFEKNIFTFNEPNPFEISFIETRKYEDRNDKNMYLNFLKSIIPTNELLIKNSYKLYKNETTNVGLIAELEHFMIYPKDIDMKQHDLINTIIDKNITRMKKTLAKKENIYMNKSKPFFEHKNIFSGLFDGKYVDDLSTIYKTNKLSINESLKNIINHDGGRSLYVMLSLSQQTLYQKKNFNVIMEEQLNNLKNEEDAEMEKELCKEFILTKIYKDIALLQNDNGKEEIFYDKEYDTTRYDIMNKFEADKDTLNDEELLKKITEHLIKNVGVEKKKATVDAYSMIIGKKQISDGDYAVLDLGDYEFRYYERKNNNWRLNDDLSDKMPDDTMFCNIKAKCLKFKNECSTMSKNNIENQKILLNDIANNFSEKINIEHKKQLKTLLSLKEEYFEQLKDNIDFDMKKLIERDLLMVKLANTIEESNILTSPNSKLRDAILGQTDIIKKYSDIILFIKKFCREHEPSENENWFYCVDSNLLLLPTYFLEMAESFENGDYNSTINKIIKKRGVISDDGGKTVDKHSGYVIKIIKYDNNEGYDKEGRKINTREVLDEDDELVVRNALQRGFYEKKSKTSKIIKQLINAISKNIGIDLKEKEDNMIKLIIQLNNENTKSKKDYDIQVDKLKNNSRSIKQYDTHVYEILFLSLISVFIITVQTAIPEIKTSKTYPGCVKSFNGFPLNTAKNEFLNYVVCVLIKIKGDKKIWSGLPNIRKITKSSLPKFEKYVLKVKKYIQDKALNKVELFEKLKIKREWLIDKKTNQINEEYKLQKWETFLPPINKVNIGSVQMLASAFIKLFENTIRKGSNNQFKLINNLNGKLREFSFAIIEKINKIVEKKELLFVTASGIPYLQNACCNDKNNNVYDYFVEEDATIKKYNDNISILEEIKTRNTRMQQPGYFFSDTDTTIVRRKIVNNITEETIYSAFIKHCKFNSGLNLPDNVRKICGSNVSSFNKYDTISEKIFKMKNEDGLVFDLGLFNNLIKTIHKNNILNLEIIKKTKIKKTVFEEAIKFLLVKESNIVCNNDILKKIIELFDRFSIIYNEKTDNLFEDFILIVNDKILESENKIKTFLKENLKKGVSKNIKFINKLDDYVIMGDDNYMSIEDNSNYRIGIQLKNMIYDICRVFPEIVINNVNYDDKVIPKHWKLSKKHMLDLKNKVGLEMKGLNSVYNNKELNILLKKIIKKSVNLLKLVENIPFYSDVMKNKQEKSILNGRFYKIMHKYFFICALNLYISIFEEMSSEAFLVDDELFDETESKSVDEAILKGRKSSLKKKVATMISKMLNIFSKRKKMLNVTKKKIKKNVMKSRVKEKFGITENLRKLSDEQRKIEDILKNLKLGNWGMGQTKALFEYDPNQYDKERDNIEKNAIIELQMGKLDDVTLGNMEIYMMEHLEENYREDRLLTEELALDVREDRDGEEEW